MELNNTQKAAVKAAINADAVLGVLPNTTAAADRIAREFNKNSSPEVIVWKSSVTKADLLEQISYADLLSRTADQRAILSIYLQGEVIPCDRQRVRTAFDTIFSGTGTATRLLAFFKRTATRGEALFATGGTGLDDNPHRLVKEGDLLGTDIELLRAS